MVWGAAAGIRRETKWEQGSRTLHEGNLECQILASEIVKGLHTIYSISRMVPIMRDMALLGHLLNCYVCLCLLPSSNCFAIAVATTPILYINITYIYYII